MAEDTDKESKTEDPTSKRLSDARERGQVPNSKEVSTALLLLAATGLLIFQGETVWLALQEKLRFFLQGGINGELTPYGVVTILREMVIEVLWDLAPTFLVFLVASVTASFIQHGFLISFESIKPSFSKINPLQGLKRLFSMNAFVDLFKSVLKMTLISIVVYMAIRDSLDRILGLAGTNIVELSDSMADDTIKVFSLVATAFLVLAIIDFVYQRREFMQNLRMTKQEVKDEQKQVEGDPLIKGRIRQIQREMAQRRMMEEVPKADVVITNPTHFAVALKYVTGEMSAPKVVAKGAGFLAERIRKLAGESRVPLVENPPLARSLYKDVDINQAIPPDLFKAVAEVLAYVYSLRRRG
ncbi:MAG: flagellar biosynthesis protein FlhB [Magnetococcales bacterium]|nr:flagellar biosynthesis protein FlhB [Magnetococcales bacterium]MBF0157595.1 flagellar biosynthesis protein FlhB [Magnetococcales bacterium]